MTIAPTLQKYLDQTVTYELISHDPTMSSTRTAEACNVPGDYLAKGVVLRRDGGYLLAILPASHHIRLSTLKMQLGDKVALASEDEIAQLFATANVGPFHRLASATGSTSSSTTVSRRSARFT